MKLIVFFISGIEVEVQISPCACTRTIHTTLPAPCPQDADSLLERVVREYGDSTCSDLATLRGVDQQVGNAVSLYVHLIFLSQPHNIYTEFHPPLMPKYYYSFLSLVSYFR